MSTLRVNGIHREGRLGIVLSLETLSPGDVKCGYRYRIRGRDMGTVSIKTFENDFCPGAFEHPSHNILAVVCLSFDFRSLKVGMVLEPQ